METKILLTTKKYEKNPKTKTTYKLISTEVEKISHEHYDNSTDKKWARVFKNFGGSCSRKFRHTNKGYKCVKVVTLSPDKKNKSIYEYTFL